MRPCRLRRDSAITVMTAASKARDMAFRGSVRTLKWPDMAPSWANALVPAAAARNEMNHRKPFGVGVG